MAKSTPSIEEWENWLDENQDHPSFEKVQGDYLKLVAGGSGVAVPKSEEAKGSAREELFLEALAPPPTPPENKPGDFMRGLASGKDYGDLLIGSALEGARGSNTYYRYGYSHRFSRSTSTSILGARCSCCRFRFRCSFRCKYAPFYVWR